MDRGCTCSSCIPWPRQENDMEDDDDDGDGDDEACFGEVKSLSTTIAS